MIRDREQVAIPVDFKISNGKIGGTDIDFLLEFDDKFLIIIEIKREGKELTTGQRLVLERMINAWRESGRKGIAIFATYKHLDEDGFINLQNCKVHSYYTTDHTWDVFRMDVIEFINLIGRQWKCHKCKF